MRELNRAQALCDTVSELHRRGFCLGTGGNFSIVDGRDPLTLSISRSGVDKGSLTPEDLLTVDAEGAKLEGEGKPSAETLLHTTLAAGDPELGCVLHVHTVWNTLLGERFCEAGGFRIRGYEMQKGLRGVTTHEADVWVPVLPNDQDMRPLAERVRELMAEQREGNVGFLLAGHGLYAWGRTIAEAKRHIEIYEFLFEVVGRRTALAPFEG